MPAKGSIEQVWLFTCGQCGKARQLAAQTRSFAVHLVESGGGLQHPEKGWLCPTCRTVALPKQAKP